MSVRRSLRGEDSPAKFEVHRADGCDTMNLGLGDRLVVVVGQGVGLGDPGSPVGPDNYNSAWYHLRPDGRLELAAGSSWIEGLPSNTTLDALLASTDAMPSTDTADPLETSDVTGWPVGIALSVVLVGLLVAMRRLRTRS